MGHDSEWGDEKPGQGIMNKKKGSADDFCTIWEWNPGFLGHLRAGHVTSLWSAPEATRKPLRPAAHVQKGLVHLTLTGNNNYLRNRCSYVTFVPLI